MRLFYQPNINKGDLFLDSEESRHCIKVLRMNKGDTITVIDGSGSSFDCQITAANPRKCLLSIEKENKPNSAKINIHIAIAPTKNIDRMEWFVEKCVELGISTISFISTDQSERKVIKPERLERKAISAMKQSRNFAMPDISEIQPFHQFVTSIDSTQKYIAYVDETNNDHLFDLVVKGEDCLILIGPEGDFTKSEIDLALSSGFKPASLGESRLRTETAGISACQIINLRNR